MMKTSRVSGYTSLARLNIRDVSADASFCVLDFETNGMYGDSCEVIEFAAVKVNGRELVSKTSSLCGASAPLSNIIRKLTGIRDGMLIGKPPFETYLEALLEYIGDDIVVAHNAPFDVGILLNYCGRQGISFRPRVLCTLTAARRLFPELPGHKLEYLSECFSLKDGRSHRALNDTLATARLLLFMFEYLDNKYII